MQHKYYNSEFYMEARNIQHVGYDSMSNANIRSTAGFVFDVVSHLYLFSDRLTKPPVKFVSNYMP